MPDTKASSLPKWVEALEQAELQLHQAAACSDIDERQSLVDLAAQWQFVSDRYKNQAPASTPAGPSPTPTGDVDGVLVDVNNLRRVLTHVDTAGRAPAHDADWANLHRAAGIDYAATFPPGYVAGLAGEDRACLPGCEIDYFPHAGPCMKLVQRPPSGSGDFEAFGDIGEAEAWRANQRRT